MNGMEKIADSNGRSMNAAPEPIPQGGIIRLAQTLARALLDAVPDPAWVKDAAGRYVAVNSAFRRVCEHRLRRPDVDIVGLNDYDLFPAEDAERAHQEEHDIMAKRGAMRGEQVIHDSQGEARRFEIHRIVLLGDAGGVSGTVGFARDVTDAIAGA